MPAELEGERLDRALAAIFPDLSRTLARRVILLGAAYIGKQRCRVAGRRVRRGDLLTATWHPAVREPLRFPLEIVHEDARVLVVYKAAGQLTQGSELGDEGTLIRELAKRFGDEVRLLHRLDAPTSGLLLATRDREASALLTPQFRAHTIERRYVAVTEGAPAEGDCRVPLLRSRRRMRAAGPDEEGLSAWSTFRVRQRHEGRAVVEAELHTGRTHQIRVHLVALGCPVVGDAIYGGPPAARMCLHASTLGFKHPDAGPLRFERAPPAEFWEAAGIPAPRQD